MHIESTIHIDDVVSPSTEVSYLDNVENMIAVYQEQLAPLLIKTSDFVMGEEIGQGLHNINNVMHFTFHVWKVFSDGFGLRWQHKFYAPLPPSMAHELLLTTMCNII